MRDSGDDLILLENQLFFGLAVVFYLSRGRNAFIYFICERLLNIQYSLNIKHRFIINLGIIYFKNLER